jgi:hypothetical protein
MCATQTATKKIGSGVIIGRKKINLRTPKSTYCRAGREEWGGAGLLFAK